VAQAKENDDATEEIKLTLLLPGKLHFAGVEILASIIAAQALLEM
jgi:hypothetical protein